MQQSHWGDAIHMFSITLTLGKLKKSNLCFLVEFKGEGPVFENVSFHLWFLSAFRHEHLEMHMFTSSDMRGST